MLSRLGTARWGPRALSGVLLILLGALLAQLTWQILAPDLRPGVSLAPDALQVAVLDTAPSESPLLALAEIALFGELGARPVAAPSPPPPVQETRLRLRLLGLVAGEAGDTGYAIIADGGQPEQVVRIGDALGGGQAYLRQIHAEYIVLERANGALETLRLPRADGSTTESPPALAPTATPLAAEQASLTSAPAPPQPRIQRSEWLESPERLLQSVHARPVLRGGQLHGLEVRPTRNARQFQEAGLRPGDIITAVGGVPLAGIDNPNDLLARLARETQIDVMLERDGQAQLLTVRLDD